MNKALVLAVVIFVTSNALVTDDDISQIKKQLKEWKTELEGGYNVTVGSLDVLTSFLPKNECAEKLRKHMIKDAELLADESFLGYAFACKVGIDELEDPETLKDQNELEHLKHMYNSKFGFRYQMMRAVNHTTEEIETMLVKLEENVKKNC